MGVKLERKKKRMMLLTVIYRAQKLLPLSQRSKFKLFLNLEWIFHRLSHESSFKNYPHDTHPVRQMSKKFIMTQIDENSVVLDLGCNLGEISYMVSEVAKEVVGIDYIKNAIDIAKQNFKRDNLSFIHGEALAFLNANDKKFDTLILSHILEHLDDPKGFLMSFKDHFRYIYIELPDFDRYYFNQYRKDLDLSLIYTDEDHITEFDRDELKALLDECGLSIIREEYRYGVQKVWCKTT